jgi:hypothetical protein
MQREFFLKNTCGVPAEDLEVIRKGYDIMRGRGEIDNTRERAYEVGIAVHNAKYISQGTRTDLTKHLNVVKKLPKTSAGNSRSYLLRRIARGKPGILDQYKEGKFRNVREAADAAGIPRLRSKNRLLKEWHKASDIEKEELLKFIRQNSISG